MTDPVQRAKYDAERKKFRNLNIPPYNPNTPRTRPPPPSRSAYTTTPSGSYYRAPPPKPSPQRPPPPQHHPTFANGADRFTSKNFRAPPTAQRPDSRQKDAEARANVFTAWQKMKQPRAEEPRSYNPSNPNGVPFGRSKSTRVPSSKTGFDPATPGGDEGQARSSYRSNYERPGPSPPVPEEPLKNVKPHTTADEVPYAEANRMRTPYYSTVPGERTSMFGDGLGKSASVRNSPTHPHRPGSSADQGFYSDSGRRPQRNSYGGHTAKQRFPNMYSSSSDEESESEVFRSGTKHRGPPPKKESPEQKQSWGQRVFGTPQKHSPPSRTSPNPPNTFKSRSEESINMKFSPSDWHGKFEGKPDYFAPNMQKGTSSKGRTSPTRGRTSQRTTAERNPFSGQSVPPPTSSFGQAQSSHVPPPPPPPGPPPNAQTAFPRGAAPAPHTSKFAPEAWAETFREPSWAYPLKTKETSPRRGSATGKRPNAARKPSLVPEGSATVAKESTKSKANRKYQAFAEDASNGGGEAMDIDSNTPTMEESKPSPPRHQSGPKSFQHQKADTNGAGIAANGNATASPSATSAEPPAPGLGGLSGLANVEPFLPAANGGLGGLNDLKDNLPFRSQASTAHPTKPNTAQKLKFPTVPGAPKPPAKLDQASTNSYFTQMEGYVRDFKEYSKAMTAHFAARDAELEDLDARFIHNRGETTKKLGFASYLNKMKVCALALQNGS